MEDLFNDIIVCRHCRCEMEKLTLNRNGFLLRMLQCPSCHKERVHPSDEVEYQKFMHLKNKEFRVKMRIVGNSYTVSIPKEIVSFMEEQERLIDSMVKLCFEERGRLSMVFNSCFHEPKTNKKEELGIV